ncbi:BMN2 family [Babesia microti strain RI]|uniref:BMN2 family n=1 Tax=Babesia microti (strain RI) TaxID=1133968 RepID=A0A1R4AB47_BABMR|nr:BMN2 family [Babesia microti strain RI]SJK86190.1 BMN2 family [Babesia microti strain RI]|eukprot:XP_012648615.2 BMN2 family [Babesia microti strain RI]
MPLTTIALTISIVLDIHGSPSNGLYESNLFYTEGYGKYLTSPTKIKTIEFEGYKFEFDDDTLPKTPITKIHIITYDNKPILFEFMTNMYRPYRRFYYYTLDSKTNKLYNYVTAETGYNVEDSSGLKYYTELSKSGINDVLQDLAKNIDESNIEHLKTSDVIKGLNIAIEVYSNRVVEQIKSIKVVTPVELFDYKTEVSIESVDHESRDNSLAEVEEDGKAVQVGTQPVYEVNGAHNPSAQVLSQNNIIETLDDKSKVTHLRNISHEVNIELERHDISSLINQTSVDIDDTITNKYSNVITPEFFKCYEYDSKLSTKLFRYKIYKSQGDKLSRPNKIEKIKFFDYIIEFDDKAKLPIGGTVINIYIYTCKHHNPLLIQFVVFTDESCYYYYFYFLNSNINKWNNYKIKYNRRLKEYIDKDGIFYYEFSCFKWCVYFSFLNKFEDTVLARIHCNKGKCVNVNVDNIENKNLEIYLK